MDQFFYTFYKTYGNKILMRYVKNGESKKRIIDFYKPKLYLESQEESELKDIFGNNVKEVEFDNFKEAKEFSKQYEDVDNFKISGNSDFSNQFIIELFDGKTPEYDPSCIKVGIIDIEVTAEVFPDPEIHRWPVTAITILDKNAKIFYVFGLNEKETWLKNKAHEKVEKLYEQGYDLCYKHYTEEEILLREFLQHMNSQSYHATSGWNSEFFDWPYLINRCNLIVGEQYTTKMLSPFGIINKREVKDNYGNKKTLFDVVGVPDIDYLSLYRKHIFTPRESYKLDFIADQELGEKKLDYADYGSLETLYYDNYQLFIDYNVMDVDLIRQLDDKLGLFNLTFALTYYTLTNMSETLGTVKIWEHLIAKHLYSTNRVPLFKSISKFNKSIEGGYVKQPIPGMYEWTVAFDLNSLYPHIEMQYNIGPETRIMDDELPDELLRLRENHTLEDLLNKNVDLSVLDKYDVTMTGNFQFYRKDKMSFFSEIKRDLYSRRKVFKKEMLGHQQEIANTNNSSEKKKFESLESKANNMQMAMKILLNGGYGALANAHFIYFMIENAEAITLSGQLVNRWTGSRIDSYLCDILGKDTYWVYSDTDSGYYTLKNFVKTLKEKDIQKKVDQVDRFCKEIIKPKIDDVVEDLCDYMNGYEQKMVWEREVISERAVWLAKKRYVMTVWDNEGVRYKDKPKLKYTGVDAVRSSTPMWSRESLKDCYFEALTKGESAVQDKIQEVRSGFDSMSIDEIAIPRGVNGLEKYYDKDNIYAKGTPIHVKGSLIHNHLIEERGLNVNKITSGSKIKFVPLKSPNTIRQDVISFERFLPKDFGLDEYVDRDSIFKGSFLTPIESFLEPIGWSSESINTLF